MAANSSRYVIAGDDCDRVYLALQNRFICDSLQTPGPYYESHLRPRTGQPRKVYDIINKRAARARENQETEEERKRVNLQTNPKRDAPEVEYRRFS